LLAAAAGRRFVDLDEIGGAYYAEAGWTMDRLRERIRIVGRVAAEREWEPARAHAVRRALEAHPSAIVALGAGHSHYTDPELFESVRCALDAVPHVILVKPCASHEPAVEVLRRRGVSVKGTDWTSDDGHDFLDEWVRYPGNALLATATLYTDGDKPSESVDRLLPICDARRPRRRFILEPEGVTFECWRDGCYLTLAGLLTSLGPAVEGYRWRLVIEKMLCPRYEEIAATAESSLVETGWLVAMCGDGTQLIEGDLIAHDAAGTPVGLTILASDSTWWTVGTRRREILDKVRHLLL
ncbi:hypothetical protein JYK22_35335, partial [Nonomuraea sp. RK-328]|nr:hypothetical protein [Nonomuraea sp. RK-328]